MDIHLPIESLKPRSGLELVPRCEPSTYQPFADDITIAPSGPVLSQISRFSQCSTTGVTKAMVCAILSVGWCI